MTRPDEPRLTAEQLLEIEQVCDRFEQDRRLRKARSIESYVAEASEPVRERLAEELRRLEEDTRFETLPGAPEPLTIVDRSAGASPTDPTRLVRAGRYEIHERLGSGGAGTVWRAYDRQLVRWVALKTPHAGIVSDVPRFMRESRSAAKLNHPRIVRLLDAGQDESGCYMVSELVDGMSLGERLRRQPYLPRDAAALLADIADGLAYAHEQGIVHRDLKPHNILLDRLGAPYISDFGLAKEWESQSEHLTQTGAILGTPAFMAPEQARGDVARIDPRTDIYAMGVMLFQLLTGELPFRGNSESVLYQVLNVDPPSPRTLNRQVPVELEVLCLKCLEKAPERRFARVGELTDELRRFLAHRPILSRQVGTAGRLLKWSQRNPRLALLSFATSSLVVVVAAVSTAAAVMLASSRDREVALRVAADDARQAEHDARQDAEAAARRAIDEATLSRQSLEFLESTLQASDPVAWVLGAREAPAGSTAPSDPPQLRELLDSAALRVRDELGEQPRIRARLIDTIANAYRGLGEYARCRDLLTEAATVRRDAHLAEHPAVRGDVARNEFYAGLVHQDLGESEAAGARFEEAIRLLDLDGRRDALLRADVKFHQGWLLVQRRQNSAAEPLFREALELRAKRLPAHDRSVLAARIGWRLSQGAKLEQISVEELQAFAASESWVAQIVADYLEIIRLRGAARFDDACSAYGPLVQQLEERLGERHPLHVLALGEYAELLWKRGDYRTALPVIRRAIKIGESLAPSHPKLQEARLHFAMELLRANRFEEADAQFRKVLEHHAARRTFSFEAHQGLVWTCLVAGRADEGKRFAEELVRRASDAAPHQQAWARYALARAQQACGETAAARESDEAAHRAAKSLEPPPEHPMWLERLGTILIRERDNATAERWLERAVALERKSRPADHPSLADRLTSLAGLYARTERPTQAAEALAEALRIREANLPADDARLAATREQLERLGRP